MSGEVVFMPSEDDFVAAQRDYFHGSMRGGRRLLLFLFIPVACALIGALDGEGSLASNMLLSALGGTVVAGIALLTLLALVPLGARRTFRQQRNLHKEFQYGWSEVGLSHRSRHGSGIMPWQELHRWQDGRHTFLLYVNDRLFHFLPKRVMTAEEAADLRQTLREFGPPPR